MGLQIALEALGAAVLGELEAGIARRVPALAPLHRVLARQEVAHHAFGVRRVRRAVANGELSQARLRAALGAYRALAGGLLGACAELLDGLGESAVPYAERFEELVSLESLAAA